MPDLVAECYRRIVERKPGSKEITQGLFTFHDARRLVGMLDDPAWAITLKPVGEAWQIILRRVR